MEKYKTGDIVQLKTGGPKMTIQRFIGVEHEVSFQMVDDYIKMMKGFKDGDIICQWFEGNELKSGTFSKESVIKIEDGRPKTEE